MENNEKEISTGYCLVYILRSVLLGTKLEKIPFDIPVEDLYYMAKKHSVSCMAYQGIKNLPEVENIRDYRIKWEKLSMQCALQGSIQLKERDNLCQVFMNEGVKILPLKGCLIKEMYPKQEYRQMADLDILVEEKMSEKVKVILEKCGYETEEYGETNHDSYVKKPWCHVEIHKKLFSYKMKNASEYEDIWERAYEKKQGSGIYVLTWEDFYIYMLEHFAKHFRRRGSGIRYVMDVYVFLKQKGDELNQGYLEEKLKKLNLWEFKQTMEGIAKNWFDKGIVGKYEKTERIILLSGAYGTEELEYFHKMEGLKEKYGSKYVAYIAYISGRVFMKYDDMCTIYPTLVEAVIPEW